MTFHGPAWVALQGARDSLETTNRTITGLTADLSRQHAERGKWMAALANNTAATAAEAALQRYEEGVMIVKHARDDLVEHLDALLAAEPASEADRT